MLTLVGFQNGKICIEGDEDLKVLHRELTSEDNEGILFASKTNIEGIYRYGYEQKKADYFGNPAGYVWSSRASVMNYNFNLQLLEAYYRKSGTQTYTTCAIDRDTLESILDMNKYVITKYQRTNEMEIRYYVEERIK